MKKILVYTFAVAGLFTFAACSQTTANNTETATKKEVPAMVTATTNPASVEETSKEKDDVFPALTVKDMDGKEVDIKTLAGGKPAIISFWATWCPPCRRELKDYNKVFQKWEKTYGAKFFAVSVDEGKSVTEIKSFAAEMGWNFKVLFDEKRGSVNHFQMAGIPFMVVIDPSGKIVKKETGYDPSGEKSIETLLKGMK
ncbi:MAG: TlpA disulfide reductase family protein [Bacteroidetes bacterium]|nr:TlpA disulfide reductase family protein [Bacteroidota bacterium]